MSHLALTRKKDERIALELEDGRVIWIQVLSLTSFRATLGIAAPTTIKINREEVHCLLQEQKRQQSADLAASAA